MFYKTVHVTNAKDNGYAVEWVLSHIAIEPVLPANLPSAPLYLYLYYTRSSAESECQIHSNVVVASSS